MNTMIAEENKRYVTPVVRVVEAGLELNFLLSGGGTIDPVTDDPWGDF